MTTRGFKEKEFKEIGEYIVKILSNPNDEILINDIKEKVISLLKKYPYNPYIG